MATKRTYDFLIVGSGLAGLFASYQAAKYGNVLLVSKIKENKINSWLAQGGIAVAMSEEDSTESHIEDTLKTGRGICNKEAVKVLVEEGIECIQELIEIGMKFDKKDGKYNFGLEGGHSKRRVIHAHGSSTGEAVTRFLYDKVKELPNITFLHTTQVLDLISVDKEVVGINTLDMETNEINSFYAKSTILATGGYNNIYLRNTNPNAAVGEGISMALNAGAEIRDMEFTQFHPTAFYSESGAIFLISEAVRGEGALLINSKGERFMPNYHQMGELAPRDVVAKAIFEEIKSSDKNFVYLDARHLGESLIKNNFSNIYKFALAEGIDMTSEMIPIAPAAHYSVGGIKTDINGATNVSRLFAVGEAASTGVHGANRLASNSLLECLVFGRKAAIKASENISSKIKVKETGKDLAEYKTSDYSVRHYNDTLKKLQKLFTEKVGIIRNEEDLNNALKEIEVLYEQLPDTSFDLFFRKELDLLKLANSIVKSAIYRKESRGAHQRSDYPDLSDKYYGHVVMKNFNISFEKID